MVPRTRCFANRRADFVVSLLCHTGQVTRHPHSYVPLSHELAMLGRSDARSHRMVTLAKSPTPRHFRYVVSSVPISVDF